MSPTPVPDTHRQNMKKKILLVEDNEMNMDMLSRRLVGKGYEIMKAGSGYEAIEKAESNHPDLILMDLSLPELDGYQATRQLKQDLHTKQIPIIILTAHALKSDREKAYKAGCDDYDIKPINFSSLLVKIEQQLEKAQAA